MNPPPIAIIQVNPRVPRHRAARVAAPTPPPPPPPPPVNANVTAVFLTAGGDLILMFDGPVLIDHGSPPTTWTFGGVGLSGGGSDYAAAAELVPAGTVYTGDSAVIGADDPAARTPEGGYVNGGTFGVSGG